jgi:spore coat protein U-like protein
MRKQIIAPIAAGVLLAFAGAAQAASKTASFTVSATVGKNCVISAGNLALGEFVGDNDLTQSSDIDIRCTAGTAYTISLNTGGSGDYTARTMTNGTDDLVYNLYTSNLYAAVWGDDTGATDVITGNGAGMGLANQITHTVYGRVLASDNVGPIGTGAYSDTIVATISY